jgi:hypothetical protein
MAPDAGKGMELCTCLTDRLAAQGLVITDMLGDQRAKVESVANSCASSVGVSLPKP